MKEHIDPERAVGLAALPHDDPERQSANAHAASCAACRALLEEGELVLRAIDAEQVATETVDPALKARIRAAVFAPRRPRDPWGPLALASCVLVSLVLALADGHEARPFAPAVGLHCLLYELGFSALSVPVLWTLSRRRTVSLGALSASAAAFALFGQLLLRARCPVHDALAHLLAFHLGGVMLAAALGARLNRWLERRSG